MFLLFIVSLLMVSGRVVSNLSRRCSGGCEEGSERKGRKGRREGKERKREESVGWWLLLLSPLVLFCFCFFSLCTLCFLGLVFWCLL